MRELDAAMMMLVLHHLPEPERALTEAARVAEAGGRVLLVDMLPHDRESYRQQMGHVWLGFSEEQTRELLDAARIRRRPRRPASAGSESERPRIVRGDRDEVAATNTRTHEEDKGRH